jgi:hypothetical protein
VELVINAAESGDPDGPPSLWEAVRQQHIHPQVDQPAEPGAPQSHPTSFVVSWQPVDTEREITQASTEIQAVREGMERWE